MTPAGYARLRGVHALDRRGAAQAGRDGLLEAKNGDRSENGDYLYGKKRLREIDRRLRFLTKRLDIAEVVDAASTMAVSRFSFGATVTYADASGLERTVTIKGHRRGPTARRAR